MRNLRALQINHPLVPLVSHLQVALQANHLQVAHLVDLLLVHQLSRPLVPLVSHLQVVVVPALLAKIQDQQMSLWIFMASMITMVL